MQAAAATPDTAALLRENEALRGQVARLTFQLEQLKRLIYGAKSERFVPAAIEGQATLFEQSTPTAAPPTVQVSYERAKAPGKSRPVREAIPAHFPRVERVIQPEELPQGARRIGEEVTEQYIYTPALLKVDRIVRPKYAVEERVLIAPMPSLPFPGSNLGASLAAHICVSKFCDHLPLYRQRQMLKRQGLEVSDSTIGGWFQSAATLLEPLGEALKKEVIAQDYVQVDESPIPVQCDHNEQGIRTGYHWVYHAPLIKAVLFNYQSGRAAKFPEELLKDFGGALQSDGYSGYDKLMAREGITALACMAHARRKFDQALQSDRPRAEHALKAFGALYTIERTCDQQDVPPEERHARRNRDALPILDELEMWLKQEIIVVAPKSPIGQAIAYTLGLWPRLRAYTTDGRYLIDNNRIENTIRPMAIGRKNYLFAGSDRGARHAALMYSLLGTCKLHGVEPFAYLGDVIARISDHRANKLGELLPQNWRPLAK
ncbi:MAG TPA: IS66 family transposase [Flavobacteriales bacterium]|nr:IS66 family transposase [Flavobacteriales bacterium]